MNSIIHMCHWNVHLGFFLNEFIYAHSVELWSSTPPYTMLSRQFDWPFWQQWRLKSRGNIPFHAIAHRTIAMKYLLLGFISRSYIKNVKERIHIKEIARKLVALVLLLEEHTWNARTSSLFVNSLSHHLLALVDYCVYIWPNNIPQIADGYTYTIKWNID